MMDGVRGAVTRGGITIAILLLVRTIVFAIGPGILSGDGFLYVDAAQHLLQTGTMPPATAQSRSFSVVLAPLIALLGHDAVWTHFARTETLFGQPIANAVHFCQIALDLVVVAALLRLYEAVRPNGRWPYRIGLAAVAFQPITAAWTNMVLPDTMAMTALFGGLYLLARSAGTHSLWRLALGGLLLGFAGFLRIDLLPLAAMLLVPWCVLLIARDRLPALGGVTIALCLFAAPSLAMMDLQYASQGDARYVVADSNDNPSFAKAGYFAWIRAWMMTQSEFRDYALGAANPGWRGFQIDNYPARAFVDPVHRAQAAAALREWEATGYTPAVDDKLMTVAERLRAARPFQRLVTAPGARTVQLWVNPDGGAALNFAFDLKPPLSWAVAGLTAALKAILIGLSLVGAWSVGRSIVRARFAVDSLIGWPNGLTVLSFAAVIGRACEMWALNILISSAVMESRYVLEVWPCTIALAAFGYRALTEFPGRRRSRSVDASVAAG